MASIRQRERGIWEVRVFLGRDGNGRSTSVSRTVRGGRRDAERVAAELCLKPAKPEARQTIADLLNLWQEAKGDSWAHYTRRDVASRAELIRADRIAGVPVARLDVVEVDLWLARLRRAGVGDGSIRNQLQTLRSSLAQAVRWGWIVQNPAVMASSGRSKSAARGAMSVEDVKAVIAAAAVVHDMAPVALRLAAVTGARRGELAALRWAEFDGPVLTIDSGIVSVKTASGRGERTLHDAPTKTGDRRVVALDDVTLGMLDQRRTSREHVFPWLFSESSGPPGPDRISWWWKRSRELSRIDKRWRLHDLRHWAATNALGQGYDLATVSGRLGHADAATTLRVYAHAIGTRDVELGASLGGLLDEPS